PARPQPMETTARDPRLLRHQPVERARRSDQWTPRAPALHRPGLPESDPLHLAVPDPFRPAPRTHQRTLKPEEPVKGRESFRPVAPMVRADRAAEFFLRGPAESLYMLFVHAVAPEWRERLAAVPRADGTARAQTVDPGAEPLVGRVIDEFARRTGIPV